MKHLGDITKIDGHTVPWVDCIIGGSPCQDLSIAGKRAGLADSYLSGNRLTEKVAACGRVRLRSSTWP